MSATSGRTDPRLQAFGLGVRRRREALGWSLDRLAAESAISRTMLIGVEHGRRNPSLLTCIQLADALRQPLTTLLDEL